MFQRSDVYLLRHARTLLMLTLVASFAITFAMGWNLRSRMLKKERLKTTAQVNDFERWHRITPDFLDRHAHYLNDSFPTSPITLLVFRPFTWLSPGDAQLAWALCKWVFLLVITGCCWLMARQADLPLSLNFLAITGALWVWPVFGDVQQGQTNLMTMTPLALGLWLVQKAEPRESDEAVIPSKKPGLQFLGGMLISLAICIKLSPLIFLLYFLWRRRWLVVMGMAVGAPAWLVLVPGIVFGWDQNATWLKEWSSIMIFPYVVHGQIDYGSGQSIPSMIARLLTRVPAFVLEHRGPNGEDIPVYANLFDISPAVVRTLARVVLASIAAMGIYWMRQPLRTLSQARYLAEIGAVAIFMLWASQRTWVPHYVAIIFPCFAVASMMSLMSGNNRPQRTTAIWLIVAVVLTSLTSDAGRIFGARGPEWMRVIGVNFWASVIVMMILVRQVAAFKDHSLKK